MLRLVPEMCQLSELLSSLARLILRHDWPTKLLTLLPHDTVLWRPLAPNPSIKAKWNPPVADIVHYYLVQSILLRRPTSEISNKCITPYAKAGRRTHRYSLFLLFSIISFDLKRNYNSEDLNADDVPSLQHWTIPMSKLFSIQAICAQSVEPSKFLAI